MWKKCYFFVEKTPPTGLIEYLYIFYVYDGDCASSAAQEQAKTNFDTNLGICGADCKKEDIKVYCGAASTVARRKRRSVKQLSVRMTIKITRSKTEALQVCCLGLMSRSHQNFFAPASAEFPRKCACKFFQRLSYRTLITYCHIFQRLSYSFFFSCKYCIIKL